MSDPVTPQKPDGQLFAEAASWFARMRGPEADEHRAAFDAWLARGALHRGAYNRAAEIFAMGKLLEHSPTPSQGLDAPASARSSRKFAVGGLVAAAACIALVVGLTNSLSWTKPATPRSPRVANLTAETAPRAVRLSDGSVIQLRRGVRLAISFTSAVRRLSLGTGEARFIVAHDLRPFIVEAGGGSVTAHGTVFDVALAPDRQVRVKLIEGVVEVRYPDPKGATTRVALSRRLRPGETASYAAADPAPAAGARPEGIPKAPEFDSMPGVARDFDDVRLADLVALANRRSSLHITLADAGIGEERLSGRFSIEDSDLLAQRLATLFDLVVDRSRPGQLVLRRR